MPSRAYYNSIEKVEDDKDVESVEQVFSFSVNADGKKVVFSPGNLQYNTDTRKFQFAEHQWDYIGNAEGNTTMNSGIIDLFCWGTGNNPTAAHTTESFFTDWGLKIETDQNWFTLSGEEWAYLINHSPEAWRTINVGGTNYNGLVILPDGCTENVASAEWSVLETVGAVFLPAAGFRYYTRVYVAGSEGSYWSATLVSGLHAQYLCLGLDTTVVFPGYRDYANSVRLVREVQ